MEKENSTIKYCVKCFDNIDLVTCDGCTQTYCGEHLFEHHKELLKQMEQINDQCELFRENLIEENDPQTLLSSIDHWEKESIEKIQLIAENARNDIRQLTEQLLIDYNHAIKKIITEIEITRTKDEINEINLNKWTEQLRSLEDLLKQPFPITVNIDENQSESIKVEYESPFINLIDTPTEPSPHSKQRINKIPDEKFDRIAGYVILTYSNLVATFTGYGSTCGSKLYQTGIHHIRFRIINKQNEGIFFGILTSTQKLTARASELSSAYGWRDFDRVIINGIAQLRRYKRKNFQPDDQVSLIIDCNQHKINLIHHHTRIRKVQLSIDINKCSLPWKLLVSSYGDDVITIVNAID